LPIELGRLSAIKKESWYSAWLLGCMKKAKLKSVSRKIESNPHTRRVLPISPM
jgi:hypothetical protein